jgi:hypothetical protein
LGLPAVEGRFHFSNEQIAEWGGARGSWWWHSLADTLDKVDRDRYRDTANIFASYIWGMCTPGLLPMDFTTTAARISNKLSEVQQIAKGRFALELPVEPFTEAVNAMNSVAGSAPDSERINRLNRAQMRISRILLPAFETAGGRYAQDSYGLDALDSPIPALHDLSLLEATPSDSELSHLLYTELLRERNRLSDALRRATTEIVEAIG